MLRVFNTYLYEVLKGTKPVALVTFERPLLDKVLLKLQKEKVGYFVQNLSMDKVNLFFGKKECINVIEKFLNKPMCEFSPFEDFILGSILGYDIELQCKRLLDRSNINSDKNSHVV